MSGLTVDGWDEDEDGIEFGDGGYLAWREKDGPVTGFVICIPTTWDATSTARLLASILARFGEHFVMDTCGEVTLNREFCFRPAGVTQVRPVVLEPHLDWNAQPCQNAFSVYWDDLRQVSLTELASAFSAAVAGRPALRLDWLWLKIDNGLDMSFYDPAAPEPAEEPADYWKSFTVSIPLD